MERLLLTSFSILLLGTAIAPGVQAQNTERESMEVAPEDTQEYRQLYEGVPTPDDSEMSELERNEQYNNPAGMNEAESDRLPTGVAPEDTQEYRQLYESTPNPQESELTEDLEQSARDTASDNMGEYGLTASQVVTLARRGYFEEQGISSYATFVEDYRVGEIDADDIIQAAIQTGRLSSAAANDEGYKFAIERQVRLLMHDNRNLTIIGNQ
jgi:hypothetical protein